VKIKLVHKSLLILGSLLGVAAVMAAIMVIAVNAVPTAPTEMLCNGESCSSKTYFDSIELSCSGAIDDDGDEISYSYEVQFKNLGEECGDKFCVPGENCLNENCACGGTGPDCGMTKDICCGVFCVDYKSDANNCGGCGIACNPGDMCVNGMCTNDISACSSVSTDNPWTVLGESSSSQTWNIAGIVAQENVNFRCRAIDRAGSNTWSQYLFIGANSKVNMVLDEDNDGVEDDLDRCPGTVLPEAVELNPQHYADVDGDGIFDTFDKETGEIVADETLTLAITKGCSCTQIEDMNPGESKGKLKSGCLRKTIEDWINS